MKKIIISIFVIAIAFIGCKSNPKDLITKKWRITDITMPGQILPDSIKQKVTQGSMEFTKDGKLVLTGLNVGGDNTATYTLSEDGKTLTVVANGQTQTNDVRELSKSKLSLHDQTSGSTITAVPK
jgi:hypothetical protein